MSSIAFMQVGLALKKIEWNNAYSLKYKNVQILLRAAQDDLKKNLWNR